MGRGAKKMIEDFLLPNLDNGTYGESLRWENGREDGVFRIIWKHKSSSEWTSEDTEVFRAWDIMKNRTIDGNEKYDEKAKGRFRSALNKLKDSIVELPTPPGEKSIKLYKIRFDKLKDRKRTVSSSSDQVASSPQPSEPSSLSMYSDPNEFSPRSSFSFDFDEEPNSLLPFDVQMENFQQLPVDFQGMEVEVGANADEPKAPIGVAAQHVQHPQMINYTNFGGQCVIPVRIGDNNVCLLNVDTAEILNNNNNSTVRFPTAATLPQKKVIVRAAPNNFHVGNSAAAALDSKSMNGMADCEDNIAETDCFIKNGGNLILMK